MKKINYYFSFILFVLNMTVVNTPLFSADYSLNSSSTTTNDGNTLDGDDSLTVTSEGSLSTGSAGVNSIETTGNNNTINNSGTINITGGAGGDAINVSSGTKNTVINSGTITISGAGSDNYGIFIDADYTTVENSGTITGINKEAIYLEQNSHYSTITNSGTITTSGSSSDGITVYRSNYVTVTNSGDISTTGDTAHGIFLDMAENSIVNNSGTINTTGDDANGMMILNRNNTVTNDGTITTTGDDAYGIELRTDNTLTNNGTVSTSGSNSSAIYSYNNNTITNKGTLETTGTGAHTVRLYNRATFTNTGSITATGTSSNAFYIWDSSSDGVENVTINNSGLISATGSSGYAIYNASGNDGTDIILNLQAGSRILGAIDLGDNTDTVNIYGGSPSASLTIQNAETINLYTSGIKVGNTVTTVDSTSQKAVSVGLTTLSNSIHNTINQRTFISELKPIKVASLKLSADMLSQKQEPEVWIKTFGGIRDFGGTDNTTSYDHKHYGVNIGYEWDYKDSRVGLTGGVAKSEAQSDLKSFENESKHLFLGVYRIFNLDSVKLLTTVLTGFSDDENKRYVYDNTNGLETATSDTNTFFISPSINLWSAYKFKKDYEFRPSFNLAYHLSYIKGYNEVGTTQSNLEIDDRKAHEFTSKIQLALAQKIDIEKEVEFRTGVNARYRDDDNVDATISGTSFDYSIDGDDSVYGLYAGVNFQISVRDNLAFISDIEVGKFQHNEEYINMNFKLKYQF